MTPFFSELVIGALVWYCYGIGREYEEDVIPVGEGVVSGRYHLLSPLIVAIEDVGGRRAIRKLPNSTDQTVSQTVENFIIQP